MNCETTLELLSPYIDGALSQVEKARVDQHLRRCGACTGQLQVLSQMQTLLSDLPEVEVPAGFHSRLINRIATLPAPAARPQPVPIRAGAGSVASSRIWRRVSGWALPAAAAAALAGATWLSPYVAPVASPPSTVVSTPAEVAVTAQPPLGPAVVDAGKASVHPASGAPPQPSPIPATAPEAVAGAPTGSGSSSVAAAGAAAAGTQTPPGGPPRTAAKPSQTPAPGRPALKPTESAPAVISGTTRAASEPSDAAAALAIRSTGKVEHSAEVKLAVANLRDGQRALTAAVSAAGGQVEAVHPEPNGLSLLARVPSGDLGRLLKSLGQVGELVRQPVTHAVERNAEWDLVTGRLQALRSELDYWRRSADTQGISEPVQAQMQRVQADIANLEATLQVLGTRLSTAEVSIWLQEGPA